MSVPMLYPTGFFKCFEGSFGFGFSCQPWFSLYPGGLPFLLSYKGWNEKYPPPPPKKNVKGFFWGALIFLESFFIVHNTHEFKLGWGSIGTDTTEKKKFQRIKNPRNKPPNKKHGSLSLTKMGLCQPFSLPLGRDT